MIVNGGQSPTEEPTGSSEDGRRPGPAARIPLQREPEPPIGSRHDPAQDGHGVCGAVPVSPVRRPASPPARLPRRRPGAALGLGAVDRPAGDCSKLALVGAAGAVLGVTAGLVALQLSWVAAPAGGRDGRRSLGLAELSDLGRWFVDEQVTDAAVLIMLAGPLVLAVAVATAASCLVLHARARQAAGLGVAANGAVVFLACALFARVVESSADWAGASPSTGAALGAAAGLVMVVSGAIAALPARRPRRRVRHAALSDWTAFA